MATSNEIYADLVIEHQIGLQRMATGMFNRLLPVLNQIDKKLERLLFEYLSDIESSGGFFDEKNNRKLNKLLRAMTTLRKGNIKDFREKMRNELIAMMENEIKFQTNAINTSLPFNTAIASVEPERLTAALNSKVFPYNLPKKQRKKLDEWVDTLTDSEIRRIKATIQTGFTTGQTTDDIVRQIIGTKASQYKDGIIQLTRVNAQALVRTSTATMAQEARNEFFKRNKFSKEEVWTAILDGRTTKICASRDGQQKPTGYWQSRYPAHFGERSTVIPVLDGIGIIGTRPSISDTRTRRKREIDFREEARRTGKSIQEIRNEWADKNIGTTLPKTTFQSWFKRRNANFQREYLGEARYKLYKNGGLTIDRFVDSQGNEYTLKQLAKRDRQSFIDAGLNPDDYV